MQINFVNATNIDLTDSLKDYVELKLQRIAKKFIDSNDESAQCNVELGKTTEHHKTGEIFRAEFNLHISGKDIYAAAEKEDIYVAVDEARYELRRQLKSHQEKQQTMIRKGGKKLKDILKKEDI